MPPLHRNRGFTLLEMVVSVVLLGILAVLGSSIVVNSFSTARTANAGNTSEAEARFVLERLAREIREVKYKADALTGVKNYCMDTMLPAQFVFDKRTLASSLDRLACSTDTSKVTITYSFPNLTLLIAPATSSATLTSQVAPTVSGIPGFAFKYFESDGTTETTDSASVYFVQITLTVTDATSQKSTTQRVRVGLRNY